MKIQCLGAGQEVGRSAILLKDKDNILLDYGLKLNSTTKTTTDLEMPSKTEEPRPIKENLNGIILSHAHLDHSGAIPTIFKKNNAPLFLTEGTLQLSNLLWKDTLKIAKITGEESIFKQQHIDDTNNSAFYIDYKKPIQITDNTNITFYDAGHIVGSIMPLIEMNKTKILYTGDFRATESQLFKGYDKKLPTVDYLIMETTYGDKAHINRKEQERAFIEEIKETIDNRGKVIIPAFAIERSQEIIAILAKYNINAPIYLDGMAKTATSIFLQHPTQFTDYLKFKKAVEKIEYIKNQKARDKIINKQEPAIIITTAGMLEGGPVLFFIKELGDNANNRIILTGFQVEGTNGSRLLEKNKIYIDGKQYTPKAKVTRHSFSGHADKNELIELVKKVNPKKIICVHGDKETTFSFKEELKKQGFDSENPAVGETINLD